MSLPAAQYPGMTQNFGNPSSDEQPITRLTRILPLKDRKVVLLATATITFENLFSNGLFQNVFVLYRMFEAMGYAPILIIHNKPTNLESIPPMLHGCRMMSTEQIILQPLPVVALIELGMSIDPLLREFVKMLGGKLAKLYLGNILNIDVETPIFYPQMHFAHHVIEKIDRIWVSPHYGQHAEYAAYLNHVLPPTDLHDMIAPYVWDPCIITRDGELRLKWRPRAAPEDDVFVIMEPNISFQKSSLVPLMALERWYRSKGRAWKGKIVVINGERLDQTPHFAMSVNPTMDLFKDGRVEMKERMDMISVMKAWPSAIFVCHQYNNEYNYMTLELLISGFPVIHNSGFWSSFGYAYDGNDLESAAHQIQTAYSSHVDIAEAYKSHALTLAWRHSPYNPKVQHAWEELLKK
jgi:hypothetical protein